MVKRYLGPDAAARQHNEVTALTAVAGLIPVAPLVSSTAGEITLKRVEGRPGQELLEDAPEAVLSAVGRMARRLAAVDLERLAGLDATPAGTVLVHGDFGPQNMLLDEVTAEPTAVVDWELAHVGDPVEDLAWAEWIVRTHHAHLVTFLPALFAGFGERPSWSRRQAVMLDKCRWALGFVRRWPGARTTGVELWQQRLAATAAYAEAP